MMRALHLAAAAAVATLQLALAQSAAADGRQDIDALMDALVLEAVPPAAATDGDDDDSSDPDKEYVCIDNDLTKCEEIGDMIARCVMIPDPAACCALDSDLCNSSGRPGEALGLSAIDLPDMRDPGAGLALPPAPPPASSTHADSTGG